MPQKSIRQALNEALRQEIIGQSGDDLPLPACGEREGVRGIDAGVEHDYDRASPRAAAAEHAR